MADPILPVSKLHCVPNEIEPSQLSHYYGPADGYTFWRVFVDGELLTNFAQPFAAYDPVIELFGNLEVPIWGDGNGYLSVRQIGQYVIWCNPIEETVEYFLVKAGLSDERLIVFDSDDYMETLNSLQLPMSFLRGSERSARQFSHYLSYLPAANPETSLPRLSASELDSLLRPQLPEDNLPLYRIPENPEDLRGIKLVQRIKAALANTDDNIIAIALPATWVEIHIGLDLPEFAECIWKIAKTSQGYAILFVSNPHFPLWLSSPSISAALEAEPFSV